MSDKVPADRIEDIVGMKRNHMDHVARAVSAEQRVYVMHPQVCVDSTPDLRDCVFSHALDRGIDMRAWTGFEDQPLLVTIVNGRLEPM